MANLRLRYADGSSELRLGVAVDARDPFELDGTWWYPIGFQEHDLSDGTRLSVLVCDEISDFADVGLDPARLGPARGVEPPADPHRAVA